jgi:ribosome assembly protein SQT1
VLLAGSEDGTIWMWQTPSGQCMNVFSGHIESVTCGQFTPDGKLIVSGSIDGSIIVWDPRTGQSLHKWTPVDGRFHQAPVTSISINPESTVIVSGAQDGSVLLLKIDETKILGPIQSHTDSVETIAFSKVLPLLAFGSVDGNIHVFDTTTMKFRYSVKHDVFLY